MQPTRHVSLFSLCCPLLQRRILTPRFFTTSNSTSRPAPETAVVPCRNNGSITLDIYRPPPSVLPSSLDTTHNRPTNPSILLYLPRGPIFPLKSLRGDVADDQEIAARLAQASGVTVVQVNYRVDAVNRFPTPVHDVLAGYDWALNYIGGASTGLDGAGMKQIPVGVCGELLGGTLSLSLALTECRVPSPGPASRLAAQGHGSSQHEDISAGRVAAVAANNPIVDWILPFNRLLTASTTNKTRTARSKTKKSSTVKNNSSISERLVDFNDGVAPNSQEEVLNAETLASAQASLFHPGRKRDRFDPYASPILFLRTAGATVAEIASEDNGRPNQVDNTDEELDMLDQKEDIYNNIDSDNSSAKSESSTLKTPQLQKADLDTNRVVNETADDTVVIPWLDDAETPATLGDTTSTSDSQKAKRPYKPRRVPRKWPPSTMVPISFPTFYISAGEKSPLKDQGVEMTNLLRRALGRHEFPGQYNELTAKNVWGQKNPDRANLESLEPQPSAEDMERYVSERIELHLRGNGSGLWCFNEGNEIEDHGRWNEQEVQSIGKWFGAMLRTQY